jgi:hypothetical protein
MEVAFCKNVAFWFEIAKDESGNSHIGEVFNVIHPHMDRLHSSDIFGIQKRLKVVRCRIRYCCLTAIFIRFWMPFPITTWTACRSSIIKFAIAVSSFSFFFFLWFLCNLWFLVDLCVNVGCVCHLNDISSSILKLSSCFWQCFLTTFPGFDLIVLKWFHTQHDLEFESFAEG